MNKKDRLRNADFLQMAAESLESGDFQSAEEAIYDVAMTLHLTEFDRQANTLLGAALHARSGRVERAQRYIGEVFDHLTQGRTFGGVERTPA